MSNAIKLHIGCGPIRMEDGWTNIDINSSPAVDVVMNCLEISAKFGEGTISAIWMCHALEHLAYPDDVMTFLRVARHALCPGGIMRLAVPDLEIAARAFANGSDLKFLYGPEFKGFYHKDCRAERMTFFCREWQHTMMFDFCLLSDLLRDAGFESNKILRCDFNRSGIPGFHHDRFESESLYVECRK